jgi:DNA-binding beta-propeller fold protein YncE
MTRLFVGIGIALCVLSTVGAAGQGRGTGGSAQGGGTSAQIASGNAIANPYQMVAKWPMIATAAAIGIVPDKQGGVWLQHRTDPAVVHINAAGEVVAHFDVAFAFAHGLCRDADGNFWAVDSGPFGDTAGVTGIKGNQVFKFDPNGKLLLTLGQAGVSRAGTDTFVQPSACTATPDGNILIADGHWPRPKSNPQDGDRLIWFTRDGKFVKQFGRAGTKPGEFLGPHGLAFDSRGRLFVADRSNNRIQIFDANMNVVDEWRHFGRPSGIWILPDDTLIVSDSESNRAIVGAPDALDAVNPVRNPGWKNGIRIGSAKDGSLKYFIDGTQPEGLAADELGNVFGGLTGACNASPSGGCLQKFVRR